MRPNDWAEHDSQTAAVATATRAAETDHRHVVRRVLAGYGTNTQAGTLTVKRGATTEFVHPLTGDVYLEIDLRGGKGEAVSAELSAGAAGVVGYVTLLGYTE